MKQDLDSELRGHLEVNEVLVWTGKPKEGIVFRVADIFLIPFSVVWCGFAIFWFITAAKGGGLFALFGVPFVLVGLMFVFGRFIIDAKIRENTIYGLSKERVVIKSGLFSKSVQSINIKTLSNLEYIEKSDGSGTIYLGPKNQLSAM